MNYKGPERRQYVQLSEEDFERLAHRAKELAVQEVYISVGKSVISKVRWILLAISAAASAWLASHGFFTK